MKRITRVISAVLSTALLASIVTVAPFSVGAAEIPKNDEANTTTFGSSVEFSENYSYFNNSNSNEQENFYESATQPLKIDIFAAE